MALVLAFIHQAGADYQSVVLADTPLLYLRFEDPNMSNGAPVTDFGSLGKGATYFVRGTSSILSIPSLTCLGQAAYLYQTDPTDGSGACIDINDSNQALSLPDVTYEMWFIADGDLTYNARLFQHNGDWAEQSGPGLMAIPRYDILPDGGYGIIGGDVANYEKGPADDGNWHHIVVTYDSNDPGPGVREELYVDGVSTGTAVGPNNLRYDYDRITIGAEGSRLYLHCNLYGTIDEFAIYEGVLSTDRIEAHYETGSVPPHLKVLDPNGGETIHARETYPITWESFGCTPIHNVKIEYTFNNGNTWWPIDANTTNDGQYDWLAPDYNDLSSNDCLICVSDVNDADIFDTSDSTLTIYWYPACWDWLGQCHGDANENDLVVNYSDFEVLEAAFGCVYPESCYNPCADFDRNGAVNNKDFLIFKKAFKEGVVSPNCPPGDINEVYRPK